MPSYAIENTVDGGETLIGGIGVEGFFPRAEEEFSQLRWTQKDV
jgi:hypothetical protein